jgi:hypothetical protein
LPYDSARESQSQDHESDERRQSESLIVGAAGDRAEIEADRVAARAVSALFGTHTHGSHCAHAEPSTAAVRRSTGPTNGPIGLAGGELDSQSSAEIAALTGRGHALDPGVRRTFGDALGADVSRARIHHDDTSDRLAHRMSATAFTVGNDVFFTKGAYDPSSPGGAHLLAHELAHVAQEDGGAHRSTIRRAVGFEFETNMFIQKKKPEGGIEPLQKMEVIHKYSEGFQMEADEHSTYGSAIEFVMRPPVEEHDRPKFEKLMTKMDKVALELEAEEWNKDAKPEAPSVPLHKITSIGRKDVLAHPAGNGLLANPQVTVGVRMDKVPKMMKEVGEGTGGQASMVKDNKTPAAFAGRASKIAELKGRPELQGLLCLMAAYLDRGDSKYTAKLNYAKLISGDMLVRTDFASYFTRMPDKDKLFILDVEKPKKPGQRLVELALEVANMAGTETEQVFARGIRKSTDRNSPEYDQDLGEPSLKITREEWILGITRGHDLLSAFWNKAAKSDLEGLGKLGNTFDKVGGESSKKPKKGAGPGSGVIMEMRNMKYGGGVIPGKWKEYALGVFDYIVSLNNSERDEDESEE